MRWLEAQGEPHQLVSPTRSLLGGALLLNDVRACNPQVGCTKLSRIVCDPNKSLSAALDGSFDPFLRHEVLSPSLAAASDPDPALRPLSAVHPLDAGCHPRCLLCLSCCHLANKLIALRLGGRLTWAEI